MLDDLDLAWEEQQEPGAAAARRAASSASAAQGEEAPRPLVRRPVHLAAAAGRARRRRVLGRRQGPGQLRSSPPPTTTATRPATRSTSPSRTATVGADIGNELLDKNVVKSAKAFVNAADGEPERSKNIQPGCTSCTSRCRPAPRSRCCSTRKEHAGQQGHHPRGHDHASRLYEQARRGHQDPGGRLPERRPRTRSRSASPLLVHRARDGKPAATKSIEGFLFPATYAFEPGHDREPTSSR